MDNNNKFLKAMAWGNGRVLTRFSFNRGNVVEVLDGRGCCIVKVVLSKENNVGDPPATAGHYDHARWHAEKRALAT